MSIRNIFDKYFNGQKNFITPIILEYDKKRVNNKFYLLFEYSKGHGIDGNIIYGLTVLLYNNSTYEVQRIDLCKCSKKFDDLKEYTNRLNMTSIEGSNIYGLKKTIYGVV